MQAFVLAQQHQSEQAFAMLAARLFGIVEQLQSHAVGVITQAWKGMQAAVNIDAVRQGFGQGFRPAG